MTGLQLADLAAYPIAQHIMYPSRLNLAFDAVRLRIRQNPAGITTGYGLKVFP